MSKALFTLFLFVATAGGLAHAGEEFDLLTERIGTLRIDQPEAEVKKAVTCALKRGRDTKQAADGAYHQEWTYADCGLTLDMVSAKKGGTKAVASIAVTAPSALASKRGIRIGSSQQEASKAYKAFWNKEESQSYDGFVAGSIFGGLMFRFENGKVSQMFLGAAAE